MTGHVTLTADLKCTHATALLVQDSGVTIDLNGHTISCVSSVGYMGSCQPVGPLSEGGQCCTGIDIESPVSQIAIRGPGVITGFSAGIVSGGAVGLLVEGVTITGPANAPSTDFDNHRGGAIGIEVGGTQCSLFTPGFTTMIVHNEISNQGFGIWLEGASCALVEANNIHDNSCAGGGGGIEAFDSFNLPANANVIFDNNVVRNGSNATQYAWETVEGGILIKGNSGENKVLSNNTNGNCGDGIAIWSGAHNNVIAGNHSLNNSDSTYNGQCIAVAPGTFFDVADRNEGPGNVWSTNNTCKTRSPGIPANLCP